LVAPPTPLVVGGLSKIGTNVIMESKYHFNTAKGPKKAGSFLNNFDYLKGQIRIA
jgi:hypothetical protein